MKISRLPFAIAFGALTLTVTIAHSSEWTPPADSWQAKAVATIWSTFGEQSFDQIFWEDAQNLRIIRPSYGEQQNLLAITVCKAIRDIGPPAGQQISLKFYDTDAFARNEIEEHASVTCG